jgi:hypothetical protein
LRSWDSMAGLPPILARRWWKLRQIGSTPFLLNASWSCTEQYASLFLVRIPILNAAPFHLGTSIS